MKILEIKNVTFATNKHYNCLQDVNLDLKKGEKALLFANSDSGVVELFRVILGFEKEFDGEIKYGETDVKKLKYKNSNILYVPKSPVFFENKSLEYNIKYFLKLRERNKAKVQEKLEYIVKEYCFEEIRQEKVRNLSKIQRLKLCFARSLFRKIDLVLIEDIFNDLINDELDEIINLTKEFIEKHNSASIVWITNAELIKNFEDYTKYKLEYGTLSIMP